MNSLIKMRRSKKPSSFGGPNLLSFNPTGELKDCDENDESELDDYDESESFDELKELPSDFSLASSSL